VINDFDCRFGIIFILIQQSQIAIDAFKEKYGIKALTFWRARRSNTAIADIAKSENISVKF
jgi:hypothetical protein